MGYLKIAAKGVGWMVALRGSTRVLSILRIAILARILVPEQFGIFGIAALMLAFLETFTETGVNVFLIQEKSNLKKYVDTAWIISIVRGFLVFTIIFVSAPFIGSFFNNSQSVNLLRMISFVALLRGFINPSVVKFQKELQFNKEFKFRGLIFLIDSLVTIFLALYLKTAASLVWGVMAGVFAEVILSFIFITPRPRLVFNPSKARKIVKRGKWITLTGIFNYLSHYGDDVVVGKMLNTHLLGLYQTAFKISSLPLSEVTQVVNKVTFPVYVKISGDLNRLKRAYIKTLILSSIITIPMGMVLIIFPKSIILLFLGEKWVEATGVLRVLAITGIVRTIVGPIGNILNSLKLQKYATYMGFAKFIVILITIIPLVLKYGIIGAGYSELLGSLVVVPIVVYYAKKIF